VLLNKTTCDITWLPSHIQPACMPNKTCHPSHEIHRHMTGLRFQHNDAETAVWLLSGPIQRTTSRTIWT